MFESYTVASIFRVQDDATGPLRTILRSIEAVDVATKSTVANLRAMGSIRMGPLITSMATLDRRMGALGATAAGLQSVFANSLSSINAGLMTAAGSARALQSAMAGIAASTRAAGRAGAAAGATGGGGGGRRGGLMSAFMGGGAHLRGRFGSGPVHANFGIGGATGLALGLGVGAYEEAEIQSAVARALFTAGVPIGPGMMKTPQAQQMREAILAGMTGTGRGPRDISNATLGLFRQMGAMPVESRIAAMPEIFRFAGLEARLKGVPVEESAESLVGLLHLTGAYTPEEMKKAAAQLGFASLISPLPLKSIMRTATYAIPGAMTAGLDPGILLQVLSTAQSAGMINTRSGTAWDALLRSLSPKTGLPALLTRRGINQPRQRALERLGLMQGGRLTAIENLEKTNDWAAFAETIRTHLQNVPVSQRYGLMAQAFGTAQAARAANILIQPGLYTRLPEVIRQSKAYLGQGADAGMKQMEMADPIFTVQTAIQQLNRDLIELGAVALPPVVTVFESLSDVAKEIRGVFSATPEQALSDAAKIGLITAVVGFWFGGPVGALVGGVLGAAGAGALGLLSGGGGRGDPYGGQGTVDPNSGLFIPKAVPPAVVSPGTHPPGWSHGPNFHKESFIPGEGGLHIGNLIVHSSAADPRGIARDIVRALAEELAIGHTHNLGEAEGSLASPFTSGSASI